MAIVGTEMSMSLDGFIADPSGEVGPLFAWYGNGDIAVPMPDPRWTVRTSEPSARHLRDGFARIGALVVGRRAFDVAHGWDGHHPMGVPVFVVSHTIPDGWPREDAPFTFVTSGIDSALAQATAAAGDKVVGVTGASIAQHCLQAGLLDEIVVNLVPVLLGEGIPLFSNLTRTPIKLEGPRIIEGTGVTHLHYRVKSR
jgi:dihydrofolate reductase